MIHGVDTGFLVVAELRDTADHAAARAKLSSFISAGDKFALAPQVIAEFIHVSTDAKRFSQPLSVPVARDIAQNWWNAAEVDQVFPNDSALSLFFDWHRSFGLGRKRLLDTLLAATYRTAGINSLLTTDPNDFAIFGGFQCTTP